MTYRSSSARAAVFDQAVREAMESSVSEGDGVEVPPAPDPAAGTVSPEANAAKVTGDGGIVDSDPDRPYGDGVQDASTLYGSSGGHKSRLHSLTPSAESVRLARLRLWQAQR